MSRLSFSTMKIHIRSAIIGRRQAATYATINDYILGIRIPASRRAKLGFPMSLNIFFICAY